jgi:hypothetical protein
MRTVVALQTIKLPTLRAYSEESQPFARRPLHPRWNRVVWYGTRRERAASQCHDKWADEHVRRKNGDACTSRRFAACANAGLREQRSKDDEKYECPWIHRRYRRGLCGAHDPASPGSGGTSRSRAQVRRGSANEGAGEEPHQGAKEGNCLYEAVASRARYKHVTREAVARLAGSENRTVRRNDCRGVALGLRRTRNRRDTTVGAPTGQRHHPGSARRNGLICVVRGFVKQGQGQSHGGACEFCCVLK